MTLNEYKKTQCKGFVGTFKLGEKPLPNTIKVDEIADMGVQVATHQNQLDHMKMTLFMMGPHVPQLVMKELVPKSTQNLESLKSFKIDDSPHSSNEKTNQKIQRTPLAKEKEKGRWRSIRYKSSVSKTSKRD